MEVHLCIKIGTPYVTHRVVFPEERPKKRKHPDSSEQEGPGDDRPVLLVTPYTVPNRGPYPYNQPKRYVHVLTNVHSDTDLQVNSTPRCLKITPSRVRE